jgi:hypothetical protein
MLRYISPTWTSMSRTTRASIVRMRPILYLLPSATNVVAPRTLPTSPPRAILGGQYSNNAARRDKPPQLQVTGSSFRPEGG